MPDDSIFEFGDTFDLNGMFKENWVEKANKQVGHKYKGTIRVREVQGPTTVYEGGSFEYRVTAFNKNDFSLSKVVSMIRWGISVDGGSVQRIYGVSNKEVTGKLEVTVQLLMRNIKGSTVRVYAWLYSPWERVSTDSQVLKFPFKFDTYKLKGVKGVDPNKAVIADDMCYGDGVNRTSHFKYTVADVKGLGDMMEMNTMPSSNSELWVDLKSMVTTFFSMGELEKVAVKMIDRFKKNIGGEFQDPILTKRARKHPSTRQFRKKIELAIQEKLKQSNGDISILKDDHVYPDSKRYGRPIFNRKVDILGGLTICINDTWAYEVLVTDFNKIDTENYSITYEVSLYDHFGLDLPDLNPEKKYYYLAGFRAWFVLQHLRNFKPFITVMKFTETLDGNVKVGSAEISSREEAAIESLKWKTRRKGWEY